MVYSSDGSILWTVTNEHLYMEEKSHLLPITKHLLKTVRETGEDLTFWFSTVSCTHSDIFQQLI